MLCCLTTKSLDVDRCDLHLVTLSWDNKQIYITIQLPRWNNNLFHKKSLAASKRLFFQVVVSWERPSLTALVMVRLPYPVTHIFCLNLSRFPHMLQRAGTILFIFNSKATERLLLLQLQKQHLMFPLNIAYLGISSSL